MEYNDVKQYLTGCPELAPLDEAAAAALFWRGQEQTFGLGDVVYAEGEKLDHTFCLLLSGWLVVEKAGNVVGEVSEHQIFGEMAYFVSPPTRSATVRVASMQAVILKFRLTEQELNSPRFSALKTYLSRQSWDRIVTTSQYLAGAQSWSPV